VLGPLDRDEPGHSYRRPVASLTQRATERLSTVRMIRYRRDRGSDPA
jgi:hypothetical protein